MVAQWKYVAKLQASLTEWIAKSEAKLNESLQELSNSSVSHRLGQDNMSAETAWALKLTEMKVC